VNDEQAHHTSKSQCPHHGDTMLQPVEGIARWMCTHPMCDYFSVTHDTGYQFLSDNSVDNE